MIESKIDPLAVRDQARHHSIEMTDTYAQEMRIKAQDKLKKFSMP